MTNTTAYRILINGIVQGVGFRPFIYSLATRYKLAGWVRNTSSGVEIEISGPVEKVDEFITSIKEESPPLSKIESLQQEPIAMDGYEGFQIQSSQVVEGDYQAISADVSTCQDCLQELLNPDDFRYHYPFINCTNCGPRYTIIKDIPYDRPETTMAAFVFCETCKDEYEDPLNRRFHAQPVACPACGPEIWLEMAQQPNHKAEIGEQTLLLTQQLLAEGKIGAIKGLGGFHLACNAEDRGAIDALRERKNRPAKPLAVMMPDLDTIRKYCQVSGQEAALLTSPQRPILLLDRNLSQPLPESIAPGQNTLGVMLPYTPLHYLLFSDQDQFPKAPYQVLVMTSANFRGNPILTENEQVRTQLDQVADFFLLHNRDIHIHCDDSVIRGFQVRENQDQHHFPVRRSRGYAPKPLTMPFSGPALLAVGAELKNTFCHTRESNAFLSQHLGDLKNYQTLSSFEKSVSHFEHLFRIQPSMLVHDLHPDYLSTRYAIERARTDNLPTLAVQHHHAHIASCLADNQDSGEEPVIGMAFDGIGFGDDGNIWGGEILIADYQSYQRIGHLEYFPLPGGDLAIKEPWRTGLALLDHLGIPWDSSLPSVAYAQSLADALPGVKPIDVLQAQLASKTNTPLTSSLGRLFDAVASLLGIRQIISYEGQAAIELEAMTDPAETGSYPLDLSSNKIINLTPLISSVVNDLQSGETIPTIAARFHNTLAAMVVELAQRAKEKYGLNRVALSGGVWQNMNLLTKSTKRLAQVGFQVLTHHNVPPNDGGISLGQAVIGLKTLSVEE